MVLLILGGSSFCADIESGYQDIYDKIANPDIYERYLPKSGLIRLYAIRRTLRDNKYDINHVLQASKRVINELDAMVLLALADRLDTAGGKYQRIRNDNPELQAEYASFAKKQREEPETLITRPGMESIEAFIDRIDALYAQANWQNLPAASPPLNRAGGIYVVKEGDFLRKIARDVYGDEDRWNIIYRANPQIKNPDLIYPGMEVAIP